MANVTSALVKVVAACAVGTGTAVAVVSAVKIVKAKSAPVVAQESTTGTHAILSADVQSQIHSLIKQNFANTQGSDKQVVTNSLYSASQLADNLKSNPSAANKQKAAQTLAQLTALTKLAPKQSLISAKHLNKINAVKANLQAALNNNSQRMPAQSGSSATLKLLRADDKLFGHTNHHLIWNRKEVHPKPKVPPVTTLVSASTATCLSAGYSDPATNTALGADLYVTNTANVTSLAAQLGSPASAFAFVRDSIQFSGFFGASQTADQVLLSHRGSSADKATLLIALLRAMQVPAAYATGELQFTGAQMKSILGVVSDNDLMQAYTMALGDYFSLDATQSYNPSAFSSTINGVQVYRFPETWVRAYIGGKWVDIDPVNMNNNYTLDNAAAFAAMPSTSIGDWFFVANAQGQYVKPNAFADVVLANLNLGLQSSLGAGASLANAGAVFAGQVGGLYSASLPTQLPGFVPCVEAEFTTLPAAYQFQSEMRISDKSSNTVLIDYTAPTASLRTSTFYVSHSAGLIGDTGPKDGNVLLHQDSTVLASAPFNSGNSIVCRNNMNLPTRYYNSSSQVTEPKSHLAGDVIVMNQAVLGISEVEVINQAQNILTLQTTSHTRTMAELLRLIGMQANAQSWTSKQLVASAYGVVHQELSAFQVFTNSGVLVDEAGSAYGIVPFPASIDQVGGDVTYSRIGDYPSVLGYANLTSTNNVQNINNSSIEADVWYEIYGTPAMSTVKVLQTSALYNSEGITSMKLIRDFALTPSTESTLLNRMGSDMASDWQDTLDTFAPENLNVYTTNSRLLISSSGWYGSGLFLTATSPLTDVHSYINVNSETVLSTTTSQASTTSDSSLTDKDGSSNGTITTAFNTGILGGGSEAGDPQGEDNGDNSGGDSGAAGTGLPDGSGSPSSGTGPCPAPGQPVDAATGQMWHQLVDFNVQGRTANTNLLLMRTYQTINIDSSFASGFGPHWRSNWDTRLNVTDTSKVYWLDENGGRWTFTLNSDGQTYASPAGQFAVLSKKSGNYILTKKDGTVYTFAGSSGLLSSVQDVHGDALTLTYNANSQLQSVNAPFAGQITFTWTNGRITSVKRNRENFVYTYSYDSAGRLASSTDFLNRTTSYTYNAGQVGTLASGLLASITDPIGRQITFTYYDDGKSFIQTEPGGKIVNFLYSPFQGQLTTWVIDQDGATTEYDFDDSFRRTRRLAPDGGVQQFVWNSQNLPSANIDELGYTTSFQYDSNGNMIAKTDPGTNAVTQYAYDPSFNKLIQIVPPVGSKTDISIDSKTGDTLGIARYNQGSSVFMKYVNDKFGHPVTYTSNMGTYANLREANGFLINSFDARNPSTLAYDNRGRVISVSYKSGRVLKMTYNDLDNVTQVLDSSGPTLNITYDEMQRVTARSLVSGKVTQTTQYTWDVRDRLTSVTDPLGNKTQYVYNKVFIGCGMHDVPTAVIDPKGQKTQYVYDSQQRLLQQIDPNGSVTQFRYNQRGDRIAVSDPNGKQTLFTYDEKRQLISETVPVAVTNSTGQVVESTALTQNTYDASGRMTQKSKGLASTTAVTSVVQVGYDDLDRVVSRFEGKVQNGRVIETDDVVNMSYENLLSPNLITQAKNTAAIDNFTYENLPPYAMTQYGVQPAVAGDDTVLSGTWNVTPAVNQPIAQVMDAARGFTWSYAYNAAGNSISANVASHTGELSFVMGYDGFNRLTNLSSNTGYVRSQTWDAANRLTGIQSAPSYSENLTYDPTSKITEIVSSFVDRSLVYDARGQLTQSSDKVLEPGFSIAGLLTDKTENFSYDPNGNRTEYKDSAALTRIDNSYTNLDDQIVTAGTTKYYPDAEGLGNTVQVVGGSSNEVFKFAVNGKVVQYNGTKAGTCILPGALSESAGVSNTLISLPGCGTQSLQANYKFDAFGRRLSKVIQIGSVKTIYRYAYLASLDEIIESGANGANFVAYLDNQGAAANLGQHLGQLGAVKYAYVTDHLGSVVNPLGGTLLQYNAFGSGIENQLPFGAGTAVAYGFAGGEYDAEDGRYYFRARIYDANTGRFMSRDPIGFRGHSINVFEFGANNPVNFTDPTGLKYTFADTSSLIVYTNLYNNASPEIKTLMTNIANDPYVNVTISVTPLDAGLAGLTHSNASGQINADISPNASPDEASAVLAHELVHVDQLLSELIPAPGVPLPDDTSYLVQDIFNGSIGNGHMCPDRSP